MGVKPRIARCDRLGVLFPEEAETVVEGGVDVPIPPAAEPCHEARSCDLSASEVVADETAACQAL